MTRYTVEYFHKFQSAHDLPVTQAVQADSHQQAAEQIVAREEINEFVPVQVYGENVGGVRSFDVVAGQVTESAW